MVIYAEIGIIHVNAGSGGDLTGTGVVVKHVNAGDDVYVRTHASWNITLKFLVIQLKDHPLQVGRCLRNNKKRKE